MPVQKTEAIVLACYPLGEADRIIVFHTRDFGGVRAVARGVRKVKSRLCGRLEILTFGHLIFYERPEKDLHVVNSFDIIESFQVLREDLLKMAYCSYLAELIQQVEFLDDPDGDSFRLLLNIMFMMKTAEDPEVLVRTFEVRLLTLAGLGPQLDSCVVCSNDIGNAAVLGFSIHNGGILCSKCKNTPGHGHAISVSRGTVELMKTIQRASLELIPRLRILEASRGELKKILRGFISFHMGSKRFRSLDFLESIEKDIYQPLGIN